MDNIPFSAGTCLSRTFVVWGKNLPAIVLLALVIQSPLIFYTVMVAYGDLSVKALQTYGLVSAVAQMILYPLVTGAIIYLVVQDLRGKRTGIGDSVSVGLSRLLPVLGVAIVTGLLIGVGFILCIVPGFIFMCMYWLAVPVAVMEEGSGVGGALARSKDLTFGSKASIFGVVFILVLLDIGVDYTLQKTLVGGTWTISSLRAYLIASSVIGVFLGSLTSVASAVGYHMIRSEKEGVDIEELAAVFR